MSNKGFNVSQCKDLVMVNPDVTGLGVVLAILGESLLGNIVVVTLFYLKHQNQELNNKGGYAILEKALLKILDVEVATCMAQMIATIIVLKDLTVDQLLLISYVQSCTTLQIIGCSTITFKHLTKMHYFLYSALAGLEIVAGTRVSTFTTSHPLQFQCLSAYLSTSIKTWSGPSAQFFLSGVYYVLAIAYCTYLKLWSTQSKRAMRSKENSQQEHGEAPERSDTYLAGMQETKRARWRGIYILLSVAGWITLAVLMVRVYAAAGHLKRNRSDQELKNFGQILALSTVGVAMWDLFQSYEEWRDEWSKDKRTRGDAEDGEQTAEELSELVVGEQDRGSWVTR